MSIISVTSPKGGVGKTTTATILATVLAERGASVIVIDADQNGGVVDWARLPGVPATLKVVSAAPGADDRTSSSSLFADRIPTRSRLSDIWAFSRPRSA